jgi:hypothetical protein
MRETVFLDTTFGSRAVGAGVVRKFVTEQTL